MTVSSKIEEKMVSFKATVNRICFFFAGLLVN